MRISHISREVVTLPGNQPLLRKISYISREQAISLGNQPNHKRIKHFSMNQLLLKRTNHISIDISDI